MWFKFDSYFYIETVLPTNKVKMNSFLDFLLVVLRRNCQVGLDKFISMRLTVSLLKTNLIASDISACPNLYLHASILNVRQKHQTFCAVWLNSELVSVLVKLFSRQSVILLTSSKIQPRTIHHTYTPSELQISHANYFLGTQFKMKVFTSLA